MSVYEQNGAGAPIQLAYANLPGTEGRTVYSDAASANYYYVKDRLGSTRAVYDENGTAVERTAYLAYGTLNPIGGSSADPAREKFTGQEFDEDGAVNGVDGIGAYHFLARTYDPSVGVWLGTDPMGQFWNLYSYCAGDPLNMIDPLGMTGIYTNEDAAEDMKDLYGSHTDPEHGGSPGSTVSSGSNSGAAEADPFSDFFGFVQGQYSLDGPTYTNPYAGWSTQQFDDFWHGQQEYANWERINDAKMEFWDAVDRQYQRDMAGASDLAPSISPWLDAEDIKLRGEIYYAQLACTWETGDPENCCLPAAIYALTGELLSYGQANGLLKAAPTHLAAREVRDFTVPYLVTRGAYAEILDGEMVGHSAHAGVSLGRTIQSRCADGWTSEDRWANWMEPAYRGVPVTFYRW